MFGVARLNTLAKNLGSSTPTSLTFVNFQTSTTTSLNPPTLVAGDLIVVFMVARNTTTTIPTSVNAAMATAGYSTVGADKTVATTQGTRVSAYYKRAVGTETTIGCMSGTQSTASWSASWRPNAPFTIIDPLGGANASVTDATPTSITLTLAGRPTATIGIGSYFTNGSPTTVFAGTTGTTLAATRSFGPSGNLWSNAYETMGTNSTLSAPSDWGSGNGIWGFTLSVS